MDGGHTEMQIVNECLVEQFSVENVLEIYDFSFEWCFWLKPTKWFGKPTANLPKRASRLIFSGQQSHILFIITTKFQVISTFLARMRVENT